MWARVKEKERLLPLFLGVFWPLSFSGSCLPIYLLPLSLCFLKNRMSLFQFESP